MWSNRGDFVERRRCEALKSLTRDETFVSYALSDEFVPSSDCECKITTFFDMAMGWSGLREVLVRISCNQPPVTSVTRVTPRVFFF